ncbi:germinal-center associated nuclear protein-like isoform X2 [Artemia franciscana]|uniref:germinal-center associated nuclear protein-like isoform X2 n=1 Tax=Artemia franciscana TaxID=6661 RepID=UPI0032DB2FA7
MLGRGFNNNEMVASTLMGRIKNNLVHPLEKYWPSGNNKNRRKSKDYNKQFNSHPLINPGACRIRDDSVKDDGALILVKEYTRSAAGTLKPLAKEVRTPDTLWNTILHLFKRVIKRSDYGWPLIYEFIFDRLRAIRKDAVIQGLADINLIKILEASVVFYVGADIYFSQIEFEHFDSYMNRYHLNSTLNHLIGLYDRLKVISKNRIVFEQVYLLAEISNPRVLSRFYGLYKTIRDDPGVKTAHSISLGCQIGFVHQAFQKLGSLSNLATLTLCLHLPRLRRISLLIFDKGCRSKNLSYSVDDWKQLCLYNSAKEVTADCFLLNLAVDREGIQFRGQASREKIPKKNQSYLPNQIDFNFFELLEFSLED